MISQAVAATLMTMGLPHFQSTAPSLTTIPLSSTKDKIIGKTRLIRMKGWCGLYNGIHERIPSIWKELEMENNKHDRIDRLIRAFSPEETGDDSVDISVSDRLGNCIITGKYGAGLGFSYKNCHHGFTIFATTPQAADEIAMQLLGDEAHREAT